MVLTKYESSGVRKPSVQGRAHSLFALQTIVDKLTAYVRHNLNQN